MVLLIILVDELQYPVQILGVLRLASPWMIHMKEKGDTGRYRLRFMLKFLRTALTL